MKYNKLFKSMFFSVALSSSLFAMEEDPLFNPIRRDCDRYQLLELYKKDLKVDQMRKTILTDRLKRGEVISKLLDTIKEWYLNDVKSTSKPVDREYIPDDYLKELLAKRAKIEAEQRPPRPQPGAKIINVYADRTTITDLNKQYEENIKDFTERMKPINEEIELRKRVAPRRIETVIEHKSKKEIAQAYYQKYMLLEEIEKFSLSSSINCSDLNSIRDLF